MSGKLPTPVASYRLPTAKQDKLAGKNQVNQCEKVLSNARNVLYNATNMIFDKKQAGKNYHYKKMI